MDSPRRWTTAHAACCRTKQHDETLGYFTKQVFELDFRVRIGAPPFERGSLLMPIPYLPSRGPPADVAEAPRVPEGAHHAGVVVVEYARG